MKRGRFPLLIFLCLTIMASAQLPQFTAKVVGKEAFPKNGQRDILHFEGCVDCSGPWKMTSSACLPQIDKFQYSIKNLDDNDFLTCWAVRVGVGSWFAASGLIQGRGENMPVHGFSIVNGYARSPERWAQNARVRTLELSVAGKPRATIHLQDSPAVQTIKLPDFALKGQELRLTVRSIYPGSHFDDLCISEFQIDAGH